MCVCVVPSLSARCVCVCVCLLLRRLVRAADQTRLIICDETTGVFRRRRRRLHPFSTTSLRQTHPAARPHVLPAARAATLPPIRLPARSPCRPRSNNIRTPMYNTRLFRTSSRVYKRFRNTVAVEELRKNNVRGKQIRRLRSNFPSRNPYLYTYNRRVR